MTGGCNCGAVRFEITAALEVAGYCHCRRCQRRTGGAASLQAFVAPGSVRFLAGEDRLRTWTPEGGFGKTFCADCGSHLFSQTPDGDIRTVRMGVLDEDPGIRPSYRQWLSSAAPWEPIPDDGTARFEGPRT